MANNIQYPESGNFYKIVMKYYQPLYWCCTAQSFPLVFLHQQNDNNLLLQFIITQICSETWKKRTLTGWALASVRLRIHSCYEITQNGEKVGYFQNVLILCCLLDTGFTLTRYSQWRIKIFK